MDVSQIMDQQPHIESVSKVPNDSSIIVYLFSLQIFLHIIDRPSDVELLWEYCFVKTLVEKWLINEMPWRLIVKTFVFDVISEGRALNEHMIFFMLVRIS